MQRKATQRQYKEHVLKRVQSNGWQNNNKSLNREIPIVSSETPAAEVAQEDDIPEAPALRPLVTTQFVTAVTMESEEAEERHLSAKWLGSTIGTVKPKG